MPIIIVVLYNQTRLLKKYKAESEKINKVQQSKSFLTQDITLKGEGKNEELKVIDNSILFIKSESNYCEIHINEENNYRKELLRGSLSSLEHSLKELNFFVRVHRSYIVNFNNIDKVSGTAQGYKIHFKNGEHSVPVSRKQSAHFKSLVSQLS
jgi:DNA-binding LytR/AlgR family response regulator